MDNKHDDVEVAPGVFQSQADVDANMAFDGARDNAQEEENERFDAQNEGHFNDAKNGLI